MASDNLPSRPSGEIAAKYYNLVSSREQFLQRARDCAKLTIPTLIPPYGTTRTYKFPTPYQSIGARAVNHLSSKLVIALFPPNSPFFRLMIDDFQLEELTKTKGARGVFDKAMAKIERSINTEVETKALRVPIHLALKHLIVGGNICLYIDPKSGKGRAIPLSNFVVRRDPMGNVLEIIVMEEVSPETLPEGMEEKVKEMKPEGLPSRGANSDGSKTVAIFTRIYLEDKRWKVCQEVSGITMKEQKGSYAFDRCPWLPLRMIVVDGEDYGRSMIEEYYGDLSSLEKLTKALVQFAGAAAKILFLVKPGTTTKATKLAKAESGDFVQGQKEDIDVLQLEKYNDFQVTKSVVDDIASRLQMAFLMNSAVQRNAERVTAEEIRLMAQELDAGFGGIYATLSQELQLPLVNIIMANKVKRGDLPKLPNGYVRPAVVTGIEALGRGNDFQSMNLAVQAVLPIPGALERLNVGEFIERAFAAANINTDGLFKSEEQVQAEQQQAQMAQMAQNVAPDAMKMAAQSAAAQQQQEPTQ